MGQRAVFLDGEGCVLFAADDNLEFTSKMSMKTFTGFEWQDVEMNGVFTGKRGSIFHYEVNGFMKSHGNCSENNCLTWMPPHVFMCFRWEGLSGFFCGCITYSCSQAGKIIPVKDHTDPFKLEQ